jgi:peptidoglycan/LPS O-acetylase OafA/YrhL
MRYRAPSMSGFDRIPELDGLRGVAILTVMLAHFSEKQLAPGGFGVTLFFVISGFIITRLFIAEHALTGTISIRDFYIRRFLRLTPALFVAVAAIALATLAMEEDFSVVPVVAALTYLKNYQTLFLPDHIGQPLANLGIYWSLAVEEHFYLVFPLLFILLRRDPRQLALVLTVLIVAALAWRTILIFHFAVPPPRTYMGSDTRFDSPLTGALLACICAIREGTPPRKSEFTFAVGLAGLSLLALTFTLQDTAVRETLRYTLQNTAIAFILYAVLYGPRFHAVRFLLSHGPVHAIGIVSYSLYLWHVFVLDLVTRVAPAETPGAVIAPLAALLALAIAALSWRTLEKGTNALRARFGSRSSGVLQDPADGLPAARLPFVARPRSRPRIVPVSR